MDKALLKRIEQAAKDYERDGFAKVEGFLSEEEIQAMLNESMRLAVEEAPKDRHTHIFGNENNSKSEYFIGAGDKVRFFYEKNAFLPGTDKLAVPIEQSLAKIGYGLHALNPVFKRCTVNDKTRAVFDALGYKDPTVCQSMVIFKNPKVGGSLAPHQDSSYLRTEPLSLVGIWLALHDSKRENGCLEFIPGSHKQPLARLYVRNTNRKSDDEDIVIWTAPPVKYDESQFVTLPAKRGDMVLIHGNVVHRSAENTSSEPRCVYTFHSFDKNQGSWLKENWLQPVDNDTFIPVRV